MPKKINIRKVWVYWTKLLSIKFLIKLKKIYHDGIRRAASLVVNTNKLKKLHINPIKAIVGKNTAFVHHKI